MEMRAHNPNSQGIIHKSKVIQEYIARRYLQRRKRRKKRKRKKGGGKKLMYFNNSLPSVNIDLPQSSVIGLFLSYSPCTPLGSSMHFCG